MGPGRGRRSSRTTTSPRNVEKLLSEPAPRPLRRPKRRERVDVARRDGVVEPPGDAHRP
jgi:hypothetical protein